MTRRSAAATRRAEADRLMWRAGFGARPGDIERLGAVDRQTAVKRLLEPGRGRAMDGPAARVDGRPLDPLNQYGHDVLWWLDRMVRARDQLRERMTLNWHDHFATSNEKVGSVKLMLRQYATLRAGALGRFRDLAHALLRDGAMQMWLDLAGSNKQDPNENFARELFELFTLGVNNGYTERDIREAARALTGFTFEWRTRRFGFDPKAHDGGSKRIFGKRGRFNPQDVIDLAIAHPRHAEFLCTKLWGYVTPRPLPKGTLAALTAAYRRSGTAIRPVLEIILTHPAVYAELDEPDMVKPPVVYLVGMMRRTGRFVTDDSWRWRLEGMGQVPFYPPNVAGWDPTTWLSTGTIRARFDAASAVLGRDAVKDGGIAGSQTPSQALASALKATGEPWTSPETRAALAHYASASVAGKDKPWQVRHYWPERQRVMRHLLLAGPDAQVC
jgi:uncharacterized protein (DUF1800 family)